MELAEFKASAPRDYNIDWKDPSKGMLYLTDVVEVNRGYRNGDHADTVRFVLKTGQVYFLDLSEALTVDYIDRTSDA